MRTDNIDTTALPDELHHLIELLARRVHDTWGERRKSQGWVYGPARDDTLKQHPSLVDYDMLSTEEQDYDKATAMATLQFIIDQGYEIVPKSTDTKND